jgi:hypothetical protein
VLAHQGCLTRLDGGYRKSGLLRHGFNLFCVFFGPGTGGYCGSHSGRRIATLLPSGLIRTEAPE